MTSGPSPSYLQCDTLARLNFKTPATKQEQAHQGHPVLIEQLLDDTGPEPIYQVASYCCGARFRAARSELDPSGQDALEREVVAIQNMARGGKPGGISSVLDALSAALGGGGQNIQGPNFASPGPEPVVGSGGVVKPRIRGGKADPLQRFPYKGKK